MVLVSTAKARKATSLAAPAVRRQGPCLPIHARCVLDGQDGAGNRSRRRGDRAGRRSAISSRWVLKDSRSQRLDGVARTLRRDRPVVVFELTIDPSGRSSFRAKLNCALLSRKGLPFLCSAAGSSTRDTRTRGTGERGAIRPAILFQRRRSRCGETGPDRLPISFAETVTISPRAIASVYRRACQQINSLRSWDGRRWIGRSPVGCRAATGLRATLRMSRRR